MFSHDLRQALRVFSRTPAFALAVVLILAISIAAVTAVFGIVNNILFQPLPYPEVDRLMIVDNTFNGFQNSGSYPDIVDWKRENSSFETMTEVATWGYVILTDGDTTERIDVNYVGAEYFELLGAQILEGRALSLAETSVPGTEPVAVISHDLWQNRYGGQEMVGETIYIQGQAVTVVGIMAEEFKDMADNTKMWLPVTMMSVLLREDALNNRSTRLMQTLTLLKEGVTLEQAQADMDAIAKSLQQNYPDSNEGYEANVRSLFRFIYYEQQAIDDIKQSMLFLALGSGFLLLLACVNLGSLFMVRAITRRQEFAVRLAMGIKRRQLVRLLVLESLVLTFVGGFLALILASWGQDYLLSMGNIDLPDFVELGIDGQLLVWTFAVCSFVALLFSLLPALRSTNPDLRSALQSSDRRSGGGRGLAASALVVAEVAFAVVLLIGAGLMIRSFETLRSTSIGFDVEGLVTLSARLTGERYSDTQERIQLARRFSDELQTLPGIQSAGIWGAGQPARGTGYLDLVAEGKTVERPEDIFRARNHHIVPGALQAVGIPILRGRDLRESDNSETPLVALLAESSAETLFPGQDPIGRRFHVGSPSGPALEVIGLVPDIRHSGRIGEAEYGDIYLSYYQRPVRSLGFFLKTEQEASTLAPTLQRMMKDFDPEIAVYEVETASQRLEDEEAELRMAATLMSFYSAVAILLACIGIYSVLAYSVSRRTHEIGVRMAFGALAGSVSWMILRRALALVGLGLLLGLGLAFLLTRAIQSMLFGVSPTDPVVFLLVPLGVFLLAFLASWLPTRKAVRVEPVVALRYE